MQRIVTSSAPARLSALACALVGGLTAAGCFDTGSSVAGKSAPTLVGVDPADFSVTCPASTPKGLRGRTSSPCTARIQRRTSTPAFDHPSSPPASCSRIVTFGYVIPATATPPDDVSRRTS
ncbi:MAG: hypothetical protein R3B89_25950 [Polyangiaceae bacterium]